jgi:L-malate glycosyltransferase
MFASQLGNHLMNLGHEVILVFVFPGKAELPFTGRSLHLGGKSSRRIFDVAAWKKLARIIASEQPDIIQANAGDTLKYAVSSKWLFRWKQPIVFRNASTISLYIKATAAKLFHGIYFRHADKVISVSNTSAKDFINLYPSLKSRVVTIPIGIEEAALSPGEKNGRPPFRIIHVGGFSFEKNHTGLISIFGKLIAGGVDAHLELVGDGVLMDAVRAEVAAAGLSPKVTFYGYRKNAMELIAAADVLVLPSIIEGLPGVILEAFYCKTPVVAYNVGGISEIVKNIETGYLVDKHDETGFVAAIHAALQQDSSIINHAWHLVNGDYMNTGIAKNFAASYQQLISTQTSDH